MTSLPVPDEVLDRLAELVAEKLAERLPQAPRPWLDADGAATYIAAPRSRVYDLAAEGRIRTVKDGRRLLTRPEWLDEYLLEEAGRDPGARTPYGHRGSEPASTAGF